MKKTRLPPLPVLDWKPDGTPVSEDVGDVYFSVEDGLAETRSVFLAGCGLPERWRACTDFTIAELGFGTGLNFLAAWQMWRETRPMPDARLHFVSFEGYLLSREEAERALSRWPDLGGLAAALLAQWPERMAGVQQMNFTDGVRLTLHIDEITDALPQSRFFADAWFLDGFSPAKNEAMWDDAIYPQILARSRAGARIGTYTVAGAVRRGLSDAGFSVNKAPGFGRKRQRLEAVCDQMPAPASDTYALAALPVAPMKIAIIGAGIAGACMARTCLDAGANTRVFEQADKLGSGASGNPLALVMPRLDVDDTAIARAALEAYQAAQVFYTGRAGVQPVDTIQVARGPADAVKFARLMADPPLDESRLVGDAKGSLTHKSALMLRPDLLLPDLLEGAKLQLGTKAEIDAHQRTINGEHFEAIILASGMAVSDCAETAWLPLVGRLGQIEYANAPVPDLSAIAGGHYALALNHLRLWGASFEPYTGETLEMSVSARQENNTALEALSRADWSNLPDICSRVGVRATTPDKLPLCGALPDMSQAVDTFGAWRQGKQVHHDMPRLDGVFILSGLGSRGFGFAPLMANILASRLFDWPLPTEQDVAEALSPVRFLLRGLKRGQY